MNHLCIDPSSRGYLETIGLFLNHIILYIFNCYYNNIISYQGCDSGVERQTNRYLTIPIFLARHNPLQ